MINCLGTIEGLGSNLCLLGLGFVFTTIMYLIRKALLGEIDWDD